MTIKIHMPQRLVLYEAMTADHFGEPAMVSFPRAEEPDLLSDRLADEILRLVLEANLEEAQ